MALPSVSACRWPDAGSKTISDGFVEGRAVLLFGRPSARFAEHRTGLGREAFSSVPPFARPRQRCAGRSGPSGFRGPIFEVAIADFFAVGIHGRIQRPKEAALG